MIRINISIKTFYPPPILFIIFWGIGNILTAQNVGINTSEPTNRLHIKGNANEDPIRIENVQKKDNSKVYYTLIIDESGIVKKLNKKKTVNDFGSETNIDLSIETELYEYYVFDGSSDTTIILPPLAEPGEEISFYPKGSGAATWTFQGTRGGELSGPSNSVISFNNFVTWWNNPRNVLKIEAKADKIENRYRIHKFICLKKGEWYYVHPY